jgi:hypothetical protein
MLVLAAAAIAAKPAPEPEAAPEPPVPGSVVNLEFVNGTSKASVVVDLASTDVHIEMRTKPKVDSSNGPKAPAARTETSPAEPKALPGTAATPPSPAATDSVTRLVVAGIRRGQDLFLRGEHERARQETEATLALRPTAEAHALAGSIRWVTGDRAGARRSWQEALRLDPAQPGVADMLARTESGTLVPEPPKVPAR